MASLFRFRRARGPMDLAMDMAGVRLGERVVQAGLGNPKLFAKLAAKAGLSGRACAVVDSPEAAGPLEAAAAAEGVLVEVVAVQAPLWPLEDAAFDVGIVDGDALLRGHAAERAGRLAEVRRVVRPGGRVLVVCSRPLGLAGRLGFAPAHTGPSAEASTLLRALEDALFRPARILAEREGMTFVEGFRPAV
ncbi:MAG: methyltransferase domain-containing protein [Vicinamibacterales bacterium]